MKTISAFGDTAVAEFWGDFSNAIERTNVIQSDRAPFIRAGRGGLPCKIVWAPQSSGGERAIYIQYASAAEIPCELVLNDQIIQLHAAFESTYSLKSIDWRYQATTEFRPGENRLSLGAPGALPQIHAVAITEPPKTPHPSVDEYYELLAKERSNTETRRPFALSPHKFKGMVEAARSMLTDDAAVRRLESIVKLAVASAQKDSVNGQASIPWGGPLNGQRFRQYVFERLMRLGVDAIVETGTYLGTSTAFFARQGVPVYSCESQEQYFAAALAQLTPHENVELFLQDSRSFLQTLAEDGRFSFKLPLFYLDAHWYDDLPLADEIKTITKYWSDYVIVVDDFKVPGTNYNFDSYPNGLELTLEFLDRKGIDLDSMAVLFPTAAAPAETSARRGTLVLTTEEMYANALHKERALFRYHFPS